MDLLVLPVAQFTHENLDNATKYDATQQIALNIQMAVSWDRNINLTNHRITWSHPSFRSCFSLIVSLRDGKRRVPQSDMSGC
jgi:hypothetical protein